MKKGLGYLNETERKVIGSFVKELRGKLGDEILSIRLFGSKARGDFYEDSDIDIFVLVKEKTPDVKEKVRDLAADYILDYDIPLSVGLCDLFEDKKNKELGSFFFENVEREGILL